MHYSASKVDPSLIWSGKHEVYLRCWVIVYITMDHLLHMVVNSTDSRSNYVSISFITLKQTCSVLNLNFSCGIGSNDNENSSQKYFLLITDEYNTHDIFPLTHGFYLERGWNKHISLSLKEFHVESRVNMPCIKNKSETVSRCISSCFAKSIITKSNCRYVWLNKYKLFLNQT